MARLTYLALLAGCLLATLPLELWLHTRVYARAGRWLLAVAPVFVLFAAWDWYAIGAGHWTYDPGQTTGVVLGRLPVEEVLFFVVVPTCAILAFEAVRAVRGWPAGDEPDPPGLPAAAGTPAAGTPAAGTPAGLGGTGSSRGGAP